MKGPLPTPVSNGLTALQNFILKIGLGFHLKEKLSMHTVSLCPCLRWSVLTSAAFVGVPPPTTAGPSAGRSVRAVACAKGAGAVRAWRRRAGVQASSERPPSVSTSVQMRTRWKASQRNKHLPTLTGSSEHGMQQGNYVLGPELNVLPCRSVGIRRVFGKSRTHVRSWRLL